MNIERARKLKQGSYVHVPADRGEPAYIGVVDDPLFVQNAETAEPVTQHGVQFFWVQVKKSGWNGGAKSVWPTNRLG